jgi:integrase
LTQIGGRDAAGACYGCPVGAEILSDFHKSHREAKPLSEDAVLPIAITEGQLSTSTEGSRIERSLQAWTNAARGAFAKNTERAWRADWQRFAAFCERGQRVTLPADPPTIVDYIRECVESQRKYATIARYLATIARAHRAAQCLNPCSDERVRLALRATGRALGKQQQQAKALGWREIEQFLALPVDVLRDHRDRAMVMVGYELLCRSEELVALDWEHLSFDDTDGSATVLIIRSKTDQEGEGRTSYLSPATVRLLRQWLTEAKIVEGALFRGVQGKHQVGERLKPTAVASIFMRVGLRIGLPRAEARRLTGHAARVGATQDALAAGLDTAEVAIAGRWQDPRMVIRYGRKVLAKQGAMAKLAKLHGRSS